MLIYGCAGSPRGAGCLQSRWAAGATLGAACRLLCGGFPWGGAQAPERAGSVALRPRSKAQAGAVALGRSTWDLPRPGIEPVSPELAGRFIPTGSPGEPGNTSRLETIQGRGVCLRMCTHKYFVNHILLIASLPCFKMSSAPTAGSLCSIYSESFLTFEPVGVLQQLPVTHSASRGLLEVLEPPSRSGCRALSRWTRQQAACHQSSGLAATGLAGLSLLSWFGVSWMGLY